MTVVKNAAAPVVGGAALNANDIVPEAGDYVNPLVTIRMDEVVAEEVDWLWPGRIPLGKLSILAGQQGTGKSMLALDMAARITQGRAWPDVPDVPQLVGNVVLLSCEDGLKDTIRPRCDAAGADPERVVFVKGMRRPKETGVAPFDITRDTRHLEARIEAVGGVRLVIVDPLGSYFGSKVDAHRDNEVRAVLQPLADLAERQHVAVLAVMHLRKAASDNALDRVLGSVAFTAVARSVWLLGRDRDDKERRLLMAGKMNLARAAEALAFYIESPGRIAWVPGTVDAEADDVLAGDGRRTAPKREAAEQWLRNYLDAAGPGGALVTDVEVAAKEFGHDGSLKSARKALGVVTSNGGVIGAPWRLTLPNGGNG